MFRDRLDAAHRLADALAPWRGHRPVIYAIPRGAVPIGRVLQQALGGELDVVLVHKIGAPGNPEYAIGAIDETGWRYIDEHARLAGADEAYIDIEAAAQVAMLRERRARYDCPPIPAAHRVAIVVDDGLATGATMIAALHALRAQQPRRLVCAVPVAAPDSLSRVRPLADEVVCLGAPAGFYAVGQFYDVFGQVDDAEVIAELRAARREPPAA